MSKIFQEEDEPIKDCTKFFIHNFGDYIDGLYEKHGRLVGTEDFTMAMAEFVHDLLTETHKMYSNEKIPEIRCLFFPEFQGAYSLNILGTKKVKKL